MTYSSRPAWRNQWLTITIAILLSLITILVLIGGNDSKGGDLATVGLTFYMTLILASVILYRRYSWRFTIIDDKIESKHGIISHNVQSIRVKDLRNINLKRSVFQRIFGIGDLEFSSAGGSNIEVYFSGITKPMEIKQKVQALQENVR